MNDLLKGSNSYSVSCTLEPPDYNDLCGEDKQKFGFLVNQLMKHGKNLKEAQGLAYRQVLCDSIEFR